METLKPLQFIGSVHNVVDTEKFQLGLNMMVESLVDKGATMFAADNLITWGRNLSFLRDDQFLNIISSNAHTIDEKSVVWRLYILLYFAGSAARLMEIF